ncbi:putative oxidoreductase [Methanobrevibacter arboriphilus JCM 13429 = DSM 1125]|uniref:Putative oxidoreductase n=1 Tax=Methanobrevibacter arboriphilus JCM 13429 = DSM 1125 TaxID=1300164 RepID=A0A1V6N1K0_METAZ|nr:GMC family oxidoreductase N-terminal domain-containing protein [Methanobrevibacter arboriphilus]OQD58482.1 putative oxidoreductase [Methanobrevibacter arboriphilus JCM 13429 = DSM 1125]
MVVIIGSGAGGGILAMELSKNDIPVTIIEKGPSINLNDAFRYYDPSDNKVDILKTSCTGGTTTVSAGNGVRVLEKELEDMGISIYEELNEVETLLSVHEMDDDHFGIGNRKFIETSKKLNLNPIKMPKFIKDEKCIPCGKCAFGCPRDAKWTSIEFINQAIENGAVFLDNTEVIEIIVEDNKVKGVIVKNKKNEEELIFSDIVISSAGAINTAKLLQKLGLPAGKKLFVDPFVTIGGIIKDIGFNKEVQMNSLIKGENYILAPHYASFIANELKKKDVEESDIFSIMVKIPDDSFGQIKDGKVIKENSEKDVRFIAEGSAVAGAILINSGVDPKSIISTNLRGAHPGGTAAIGEIVDLNLETKIKGLYVSDASVLPKAPGAPPILTILALSKKLSKHLISKLKH